jgi:hypothetical protein
LVERTGEVGLGRALGGDLADLRLVLLADARVDLLEGRDAVARMGDARRPGEIGDLLGEEALGEDDLLFGVDAVLDVDLRRALGAVAGVIDRDDADLHVRRQLLGEREEHEATARRDALAGRTRAPVEAVGDLDAVALGVVGHVVHEQHRTGALRVGDAGREREHRRPEVDREWHLDDGLVAARPVTP